MTEKTTLFLVKSSQKQAYLTSYAQGEPKPTTVLPLPSEQNFSSSPSGSSPRTEAQLPIGEKPQHEQSQNDLPDNEPTQDEPTLAPAHSPLSTHHSFVPSLSSQHDSPTTFYESPSVHSQNSQQQGKSQSEKTTPVTQRIPSQLPTPRNSSNETPKGVNTLSTSKSSPSMRNAQLHSTLSNTTSTTEIPDSRSHRFEPQIHYDQSVYYAEPKLLYDDISDTMSIPMSSMSFTEVEDPITEPHIKNMVNHQVEQSKIILEREKQLMVQKFEKKIEQHIKEEKARLARLWSQEKRDILRKANEDRQELMLENSRLRKELSSKLNMDLFSDEKQNLSTKVSEYQYEIELLQSELHEAKRKLEEERNIYERGMV